VSLSAVCTEAPQRALQSVWASHCPVSRASEGYLWQQTNPIRPPRAQSQPPSPSPAVEAAPEQEPVVSAEPVETPVEPVAAPPPAEGEQRASA
jgi:hypothetical protein